VEQFQTTLFIYWNPLNLHMYSDFSAKRIGAITAVSAILLLAAPAASEVQINDPDGMTLIGGNLDINGQKLLMDSVRIGDGSSASGDNALAVGKNSEANGFRGTAVGNGASADGDEAVAVGDATATANSVAIGKSSTAFNTDSTAVGGSARAAERGSIAVGRNSIAWEPFSIAIGYDASANNVDSVALGPNSATENDFTIAVGNPDPTVSTYDLRVHNGDIIADGGDIRAVDGGSKNFVQSINETHNAVYTSQESGEVRAIWEKSGVLLEDGEGYIETPKHFRDVTLENESMIVHVTPERPVAVGAEEKSNKGVKVRTSTDRDVRVDITVKGIREGFAGKEVLEER
jgi:hypothetical protein